MTPKHFALISLFFYVLATFSSFINSDVDYKSYYSAIFFMIFTIFLEISIHNKK